MWEIALTSTGSRDMDITFYTMQNLPFNIRRAEVRRDWMEETPERFAYRCLPLNVANTCGWEILNSKRFTAIWDGGTGTDAIKIDCDGRADAVSHFGSGVLTIHVNCLIETPKNINLWVGGRINEFKDGIAPLNGIVETCWSPYTFTMNWKFTTGNHEITFEAGEPFCQIFPMSVDLVEDITPRMLPFEASPELKKHYEDFDKLRTKFIDDLKVEGSYARDEKWQRMYQRGIFPDGTPTSEKHRTKINMKPFAKEEQKIK